MNDIAIAQMTQDIAKPKFRGRKILKSKVQTHHPGNLEREYIRCVNAYMKMLNRVVAEHFGTIKSAAAKEKELSRTDDLGDLKNIIDETFFKIKDDFTKRVQSFGIEKKLNNLANLTRSLSVKEWKKVCKSTLGVNLLDDYYMGEFYSHAIEAWVNTNVSLIKSVGEASLTEMQNIVQSGYMSGVSTSSIANSIQAEYGMSRNHARFIARDQLSKLNADITKSQQQDAGVEEYIWSTSKDERVRERHEELDGKTFRWDDPPVVDDKTGRKCHPGEDFQCRCCALPVFKLENLSLPVSAET